MMESHGTVIVYFWCQSEEERTVYVRRIVRLLPDASSYWVLGSHKLPDESYVVLAAGLSRLTCLYACLHEGSLPMAGCLLYSSCHHSEKQLSLLSQEYPQYSLQICRFGASHVIILVRG